MPGFNGMGPRGNGPLTGRGNGRCGNGQKNMGQGFAQNAPESSDDLKKEIKTLQDRIDKLEK